MSKNKSDKQSAAQTKKLTTRQEDFSGWYNELVEVAELAEHSPVRGCMVIKPYGYAIWENIQKTLDAMFKSKGVQNAYFPLFIPEEFLKREAEHVEGFSPELAVVTHAGGKKLDAPLVVRPTSETIMYDSYSRWIKSYRDLPLLINQWANVVRWEMRPRLFLRTSEFLWQEGHTAHAEATEARDYALMILNDVYKKFVEEYLAIPVYCGQKSESEKFAGAKETFCIESLMQDGKTLQSGTSHNLADNFSKVFNVMFQNSEGKNQYVFQSSWGVSTRLIGGVVMSHGDDKGLILPPKIAPIQVVIVPIARSAEDQSFTEAQKLEQRLVKAFRVKFDNRLHLTMGEKFYEWEKKGVPLRLELGPKDLEKNQCVLARRDTGEKSFVPLENLEAEVEKIIDQIQTNLFERAKKRRDDSNRTVETWEEFLAAIEAGGYVFAHWCENSECEAQIKEKLKVVTRCQLFDQAKESGEHECVHCGKKSPSNKRWIFCKAY